MVYLVELGQFDCVVVYDLEHKYVTLDLVVYRVGYQDICVCYS